jgi:hypothetical protein
MEQVMEPSDQATVSDDPEACQYTINTITTPASPLPEEDIDEEEETMGDTPEETEGRAVTTAGAAPGAKHGARDSSWLELEVCREFLRKNCSRSADECRFAHPPDSVIVKDRKVTCCFDFLKDRCNRDTCKYLHPPNAIKDKLVMAGKQYGQQIATTYKPTMPIQQGGGGTPFNQSVKRGNNLITYCVVLLDPNVRELHIFCEHLSHPTNSTSIRYFGLPFSSSSSSSTSGHPA